MNKHNDGGPAFPAPAGVQHITTQGMTLRDYFAAAALQAEWMDEYSVLKKTRLAYKVADAMLAERARKEAQP